MIKMSQETGAGDFAGRASLPSAPYRHFNYGR